MKRLSHLPFWILCLLSTCYYMVDVQASWSDSFFHNEKYTYIEETGPTVKEVTWTLEKKDTFILTYLSPFERHVTTTGLDYDTHRWHVPEKNGPSDFTAVPTGETITISGLFRGEKGIENQAVPDRSSVTLLEERLLVLGAGRFFFQFNGPSGPPGSPMTTITQLQ